MPLGAFVGTDSQRCWYSLGHSPIASVLCIQYGTPEREGWCSMSKYKKIILAVTKGGVSQSEARSSPAREQTWRHGGGEGGS